MMLYSQVPDRDNALRQTLRDQHYADENDVVENLLSKDLLNDSKRENIAQQAQQLIITIRKQQNNSLAADRLLSEFSLSSDEGIVLMCLAEALLRIPDKATADRLIADKLTSGDWQSHLGHSDSLFVNASAWGLLLTGKLVDYNHNNQQPILLKQLLKRLSQPIIRSAIRYAMQLIGEQFVWATTIGEALQRSSKQRLDYRYSYDMLGESARTEQDAQRYFSRYLDAINTIGRTATGPNHHQRPGISVKLSAIHPRYEFSQRGRVFKELLPRVKQLVLAAKQHNLGFTIDAEESYRLDLSLDIVKAIALDKDLDDWQGFGLAVQAYQKRASCLIDWLQDLAQKAGRQIMVRLVKGAYWDSEIKWCQQQGLSDYPVFTRKYSTDLSYQICAQKLLAAKQQLYPQFATHNAYTVATVLELAESHEDFEFQRLHSMGESLHQQLIEQHQLNCRLYAPVGEHQDLLAYLIRRLLENGSSSSFVNNIVNQAVPIEMLLIDPVTKLKPIIDKYNPAIVLPGDLFSSEFSRPRLNSLGMDLSNINELSVLKHALSILPAIQHPVSGKADYQVYNPADRKEKLGQLDFDNQQSMENKVTKSLAAYTVWSTLTCRQRSDCLDALADLIQQYRDQLVAYCIKEAGKTVADAIAEVREAVDFCRFYCRQAEDLFSKHTVKSRGVVLCISPWNFPLAIFIGQVSAALSAGNTVLAKPALPTSLIAQYVLDLIQQAGFPEDVVQLVIGPGLTIGQQLVADKRVRAVMFTGSTETARWINNSLAKRQDNAIPLIAETGGQNAMIVDSSALAEQVVDDVICSAFQSAGQRCSSLRVLFLQQEIADQIIDMLKGAMAELKLGDPQWLSSDIGPIIDQDALDRLIQHQTVMASQPDDIARLVFGSKMDKSLSTGYFFAPQLYEIKSLNVLDKEVFGPIVHIVRFQADELDQVLAQINQTGYGLTLGIHSRITSAADYIVQNVNVGNIYINRNLIGAMVGVQPFGGQGLSGTGPKAGGPHYLEALVGAKRLDIDADVDAPMVENKAESKASNLVVHDAQHAWQQWRSIAIEQRATILRELWAKNADQHEQEFCLAVDNHCRAMLDKVVAKCTEVRTFPGPTGEQNSLIYESRGVLLAVDIAGLALEVWFDVIIAALTAGNTVILLTDNADSQRQVEDFFGQVALPAAIFQSLRQDDLLPLLTHSDIAGVISPVHNRSLKQLLAEREGAITPLICADDYFVVNRLLIEKTVTIDTTAAVGNAPLMSLNS